MNFGENKLFYVLFNYMSYYMSSWCLRPHVIFSILSFIAKFLIISPEKQRGYYTFLNMPGNHSETRGYSLTEIFTSHRESSKNHKNNNLNENFLETRTSKLLNFSFSEPFQKRKIKFKRGYFFAIFGYLSRSSPERRQDWPGRQVWRPARLRVK